MKIDRGGTRFVFHGLGIGDIEFQIILPELNFSSAEAEFVIQMSYRAIF